MQAQLVLVANNLLSSIENCRHAMRLGCWYDRVYPEFSNMLEMARESHNYFIYYFRGFGGASLINFQPILDFYNNQLRLSENKETTFTDSDFQSLLNFTVNNGNRVGVKNLSNSQNDQPEKVLSINNVENFEVKNRVISDSVKLINDNNLLNSSFLIKKMSMALPDLSNTIQRNYRIVPPITVLYESVENLEIQKVPVNSVDINNFFDEINCSNRVSVTNNGDSSINSHLDGFHDINSSNSLNLRLSSNCKSYDKVTENSLFFQGALNNGVGNEFHAPSSIENWNVSPAPETPMGPAPSPDKNDDLQFLNLRSRKIKRN